MSSNTNTFSLEVFMHPTLVDELDFGFSPMDGLTAIDNIFTDLPKVHRSRESKNRQSRKTLKIYTGRFAWYPLGFSYVQFGNALHVLELWCDDDLGTPHRPEVDAIVGTKQRE